MNRIDLLKDLIEHLDNEFSENDLYKYIGTGNPNADILIIGKESSINSKETEQFKIELEGNFNSWKIKDDFNQDNVIGFEKWENYDPLYPYKGQVLKINNNKNKGTSRTWYTYQKLINLIYDTPNNKEINFHEKAFITEVNASPSRKTKNADTSSVEARKSELLKSEFIKSFPIVIISGVGYFNIKETENEIEDKFYVNFEQLKFAAGKKSQPYWIHKHKDNTPPKLLINTYQLSIAISDKLLAEVADVIKIHL